MAAQLDGHLLRCVLLKCCVATPHAMLVSSLWSSACLRDRQVRLEMLRAPRGRLDAWLRSVEAFGDAAAVLNSAAALRAVSRAHGTYQDVASLLMSLLCDSIDARTHSVTGFLLELCDSDLRSATILPYRATVLLEAAARAASADDFSALLRLWGGYPELHTRSQRRPEQLLCTAMHTWDRQAASANLAWFVRCATADAQAAATVWGELWARHPAVAEDLVARWGVAVGDAAAGVRSAAHVDRLLLLAGGGVAACWEALRKHASSILVRAIDANDAGLVYRVVAVLGCGGDAREVAEAVITACGARLLRPALMQPLGPLLSLARPNKKRAVLQACIKARCEGCLEAAYRLVHGCGFDTPEGRAYLMRGIERARCAEAWDTFGWLQHCAGRMP